MKRSRQTLAQRRKLQRIVEAERQADAAEQSFRRTRSHAAFLRMKAARTEALKRERAS